MWPRAEATFFFGPYELTAMPATDRYQASLHMELGQNHIGYVEAMSIMSQILSLATWIEDAYVILHDGFSGSAKAVPIQRHTPSKPTSNIDRWIMNRKPIGDPRARKALALYREARTQEAVGSVSYAVLGYYKIVNVLFNRAESQIEWINRNVPDILDDSWAKQCIKRMLPLADGRSLGEYIYGCCRCAVAHSYSERDAIDPDDLVQTQQLSLSLPILQQLSRKCLTAEFGISTSRWE